MKRALVKIDEGSEGYETATRTSAEKPSVTGYPANAAPQTSPSGAGSSPPTFFSMKGVGFWPCMTVGIRSATHVAIRTPKWFRVRCTFSGASMHHMAVDGHVPNSSELITLVRY